MKHTIMAALVAASAFVAAPVAAQTAPSTPSVTAQPAAESHLRVAREFLEASGIARTFDAAFPDMALRIRQNFSAARPELLKDMDDTLVALLPEIRTRRGEIIERTARLAATAFPEAELKELNTFFNSTIGKKYVNVQIQLLNDVFQAMEPWMQQTTEFFLTRFREEMRKKGHTL
ncbi:MAG: DUF2059 domain-containing protein [Bosea sp.]|jgi:hypothetical protein|nr:DUF2059 domain-containing protein [Bosea sp. (in: a-proteobacteria)]